MPGISFPGDAPPPKKNTGRIIAIIVAVVVLAGGAGGAYMLTKGGKSTPKAQTAPTATTSAPTTPASSSTASFPDNSYTGSTAPPASASSPADGANLDSATADKTPFTADALVAKSFTDDKKVTYALKFAQSQPCAKVGDAAVQSIVRSVDCTDFMAASWIDPANNRIIVSAMVIPYPDAATATAIYKKLSATHTGDYSQWCPPTGQPGAETCTKLAKGGSFTREGKFGSFHRYVLITTAVYADLRNDSTQKDWLTSAAHGAFQNTLPGQ
jgi:flagellar basal body-associated protein FliL